MRKRLLSLAICVLLVASLSSVSFAANVTSELPIAPISEQELNCDLTAAENILGGKCKLAEVKNEQYGNYIVQSCFYTLEDANTRASSGKVGGVSSHRWLDYFTGELKYKILLAAYFYHNGTTAICIEEECDTFAYVYTDDRGELSTSAEAEYTFKDGSTANVTSDYYIEYEPDVHAKIGVSCTAAGHVSIVSGKEYEFIQQ